LGGFASTESGVEERAIVLGVVQPYLHLIRKLILTYTLEPAGSHGVWGLDDHCFIPYIFGSAQLSPAISKPEDIPQEGSAPDAPAPGDVAKAAAVERERKRNMYFDAIGFIYDVKKGPFWEHSPILFDISGVTAGWAKINKGMLKMYNAEVLSKFPVVQHFPFGSLFRWEQDPDVPQIQASVHTASQPGKTAQGPSGTPTARPTAQEGTKAPWASTSAPPPPATSTTAPWASSVPSRQPPALAGIPSTTAPWAAASNASAAPGSGTVTAAPWARPAGSAQPPPPNGTQTPTRAPWAKDKLPRR